MCLNKVISLSYIKRCKTLLYSETCDCVADTIGTLLTNYNYNSKMLIK